MTVIAKKGETITCAKGHPICDAAVDIIPHGVIARELFTNWRDGCTPVSKAPIKPCPICFHPWLGRAGRVFEHYGVTPPRTGILLHVGDEWR